MSPLNSSKIAFVGLGKMGKACLAPLLDVVEASQIYAAKRTKHTIPILQKQFPGVHITTNTAEACGDADYVVLGVKPQDFGSVAKTIRGSLKPETTVISCIGGLRRSVLSDLLDHETVVRTMPNLPAAIGKGVIPYVCTEALAQEEDKLAGIETILGCMGATIRMNKEVQIDMATALSGSSPAYFMVFLEALIDAGVHLGLKRKDSEFLAIESMVGTAQLAQKMMEGCEPDEGITGKLVALKNDVTSPGGITASALYTADKLNLRNTVNEMAWSAFRRSLEIADEDDNNIYGPNVWKPRPAPK